MKQDIQRPDAVLFDWDGTLVNTIPMLRRAHNHVRTSYGYEEWTEAEFRANLRNSARELYPRVYGDNAEQAITRLYDYVSAYHLAELQVIDGALDVLSALKEANIPTALISNKRDEILCREVDHLGWRGHFLSCVGAGAAKMDKPAADPVLLAMERGSLDMDKGNIWYVGDTVTDLLVSQAVGCKAVLLLDGEDKSEMVKEYQPFLVLDDVRALESVIRAFI